MAHVACSLVRFPFMLCSGGRLDSALSYDMVSVFCCARRFSPRSSSQPVGRILDVEDGALVLLPLPLVLDHAVVDAGILALDVQRGLGGEGVEDEVVVAVRAVLVAVSPSAPCLVSFQNVNHSPVLELAGVLTECLAALLAYEDHFEALQQRVVGLLLVALGAVEPLLAAWRADRDLGVEDVFAGAVSAGDGRARGGVAYHMLAVAVAVV